MLHWTYFFYFADVSSYLVFKLYLSMEKRLYNIFRTTNATDFIGPILESSYEILL